MACYLHGNSAQLCPISDDCYILQMEPLADRILIKPDEEKNVSINATHHQQTRLFLQLGQQHHAACRLPKSFAPALNPFLAQEPISALQIVAFPNTRCCLQVTEGGLMLTSGATKTISDAVIGKVLAKGEDVDIAVNVGDTVIFQKYSSSDVKVPDGEIIFVAQKSVLAVLS